MLFPLFNAALKLRLHLATKTNAGWKWYIKALRHQHRQFLIQDHCCSGNTECDRAIFICTIKAPSHYDKHLPGQKSSALSAKFHYSITHSKWFISVFKKPFNIFWNSNVLCLFFLLKSHMACCTSLLAVSTRATSTKGRAAVSHLNKLLLTGTETNLVRKIPLSDQGHWWYRSGSWDCLHSPILLAGTLSRIKCKKWQARNDYY